MNIDSIKDGIVIDHIRAGSAMKIYELLGLDTCEASVAIIKNVTSRKMGKKDIIKIDSMIPDKLDVIGYIDPEATVNVIRDGVLVSKYTVDMPQRLVNVISCKNPRCISSCEQELPQIFNLTDRENKIYRCEYCETKASLN